MKGRRVEGCGLGKGGAGHSWQGRRQEGITGEEGGKSRSSAARQEGGRGRFSASHLSSSEWSPGWSDVWLSRTERGWRGGCCAVSGQKYRAIQEHPRETQH